VFVLSLLFTIFHGIFFSEKQKSRRAPRWGRVARQFLDEIFSLIQRNSQDEVLGVFSIKDLVINDLKRERDQEFGNKRPEERERDQEFGNKRP
jgi:hypothetical protein